MKFESNNPYPDIKVESKNLEYAKLLLKNYASEISEDTAVHLYIYESIIMYDLNSEFANIMKNIAIVEMKHLNMLGKTIKLLGLKPIYGTINENNYITPWNSKYVNYSTDLQEMLITNIKSEETAIKNYIDNILKINDKYIKELLLRIIEDEKVHLTIFKSFLDKLNNK